MVEKSGKGENVPENVKLSNKELELFDFLRSKSGQSVEEPPFLNDLAEELNVSKRRIYNLVSNIRKKGIPIESWRESQEKGRPARYSLSPDALKISVTSQEFAGRGNYPYSALYLGDPVWGTKISSPQALKGLRFALEENGWNKEIERVFISGDTVPHVPPYDSVSNRKDAKILGKTRRDPEEVSIQSESERFTQRKIGTEWERKFFREQISDDTHRKITDLTDAFKETREKLGYLMESFDKNTELVIQSGEADKKNKNHLENALIQQWSDEKEDRAKEIRDDVLGEAQPLYARDVRDKSEEYFLNTFLENPSLMKNPGESVRNFRERFGEFLDKSQYEGIVEKVRQEWKDEKRGDELWKENLDKFELDLGDAINSAINVAYKAGKDEVGIRNRISKLQGDEDYVARKKEDLVSKLEDMERSLGWATRLLSGRRRPVTQFKRHYPITPDESDLAHKIAKDTYFRHYHDLGLKQRIVVHDSERKSKEVSVVPNILNPEENLVEASVDYEKVPSSTKKITMIHNMRHAFSNSVGGSSIKDAKIAANIENMVLSKLYGQRPSDIMILGSHATGGFRVQPWFMESEHIQYNPEAESSSEGFVGGQKVGWLINLPKFQSLEKLVWARDKDFGGSSGNWHVKAMEKGPFATGAVIHTEDKEGVNEFTYLDNSVLEEFGNIVDEIETYNQELRKGGLSQKDRKSIFKEIKNKKDQVRMKWKTLEVGGDFHLGTIDLQEGFSRDQLIKASQIYHKEHGLPDYVSYDEVLHGCEEKMFKGGARYEGSDPEEFFQRVISKIESDPNLSKDEKFDALARATMKNNRGMPIHNVSVQKKLFRRLIKEPYLDDVLDAGGEVMFTSGNHYNKAHPHSDEAIELANQFKLYYVDNGFVKTFSGKGNPYGVGTTDIGANDKNRQTRLDGGVKLFVMHKYKERQDEIYGVMEQLRKSNNDCDIALAGDRHQTGFGYADAHAVVLHPGMEPMNDYVPTISKPAGIRGEIDLQFDPRYKGRICNFKSILNPTLEKIVKEKNIM